MHIQDLEQNRRKDVRIFFSSKKIYANCETIEFKFDAQVTNVSASGFFIETEKPLKVGQEIAATFSLSDYGQKVMVTGEVIRTDFPGAGIEIKIFFK